MARRGSVEIGAVSRCRRLLAVVRLFGRRRTTQGGAPKPKSRRDAASLVVNHVGLHELTPDITRYLGQAAYLQLSIFETLTGCLDNAPSTAAKEAVSEIAAVSLTKHRGLVAEIERERQQRERKVHERGMKFL